MPLNDPIELPGERSRAYELYTYLRRAVSSGELEPGERLVESTVARLSSVSRTPVREALHRLKVDGLVREGEHGGVEVCAFTLDELADFGAVREVLEGMAAGLAATARSDVECGTLREILASQRRAFEREDDVERQVELNRSFHESLWRASRNRYLASQLRNLRELIERLQETTLELPERRSAALDEHQRILEAVEAREAEAAADAAREHFRNATTARLLMSVHGASSQS